MLGDLSGVPWSTVTPATMWVATVWLFTRLVMLGKLVPSEVYDKEISSRDGSIEYHRTQSERWHQAWQIETEAHGETRRQLGDVTRGAETTKYLLDTLRARVPDSATGGGG